MHTAETVDILALAAREEADEIPSALDAESLEFRWLPPGA